MKHLKYRLKKFELDTHSGYKLQYYNIKISNNLIDSMNSDGFIEPTVMIGHFFCLGTGIILLITSIFIEYLRNFIGYMILYSLFGFLPMVIVIIFILNIYIFISLIIYYLIRLKAIFYRFKLKNFYVNNSIKLLKFIYKAGIPIGYKDIEKNKDDLLKNISNNDNEITTLTICLTTKRSSLKEYKKAIEISKESIKVGPGGYEYGDYETIPANYRWESCYFYHYSDTDILNVVTLLKRMNNLKVNCILNLMEKEFIPLLAKELREKLTE